MKKFAALLLTCFAVHAADVKISELDAITAPSAASVIPLVDSAASPLTRKYLLTNLVTQSQIDTSAEVQAILGSVYQATNANLTLWTAVAPSAKADLASPTFTGNPAAPTQSPGDNSTKLATTAYTDAAVAAGGGGGGTAGTMINSGTPVAGQLTAYADTTGTNMVPATTGSIDTINATTLNAGTWNAGVVTSTNGITNLSLTASRVVVTDANKKETSVSTTGIINGDGTAATATTVSSALGYIPSRTADMITPIARYPATEVVPSELNTSTYDAFPVILQLQNGTWMLIYYQGTSHVGAGNYGVIRIRTSTDNGLTWSSATTIASEASVDVRNPAAGVAPNGNIVVFYSKYNPDSPAWISLWSMYSTDNGATWSTPVQISNGSDTTFSFYGPVIEIGDGKLLASSYGLQGSDYKAYIWTSSDNGVTWGGQTTVLSSAASHYTEASYAYIGAGRIVGLVRINDSTTFRQVKSENNGSSWSDQSTTSFDAWGSSDSGPPWLVAFLAPSGQRMVACYYQDRTEDKLRVVYSQALDLMTGPSSWHARQDLATIGSTTSGYPSAVHPYGQAHALGAYYSEKSASDADLSFFVYPTNTVVISGNYVGLGGKASAPATIYQSGTLPPSLRLEDGDVTTIPDYSAVGFLPAPNTSTVSQLGVASGTFGGFILNGFTTSADDRAAWIVGNSGDTSIDDGVIQLAAWEHNGTTGRAAPSGSEPIVDMLAGSTVAWRLRADGGMVLTKTITAGGTTGNQTIDKASGSVNFAAAAQSITVTCSLVSSSSVIMATVATDDATATSCKAIPGSGSFILKLNAAATAETRVNFLITN